jgi:SlyX protein
MTSTENDIDARIDDLEVRLAHQDQSILELGNEVYRQQQQIAQLEAALRQLAARVESAEHGRSDARPEPEVPPHY